jgi:hypothetical protein
VGTVGEARRMLVRPTRAEWKARNRAD